MLEKDPTMADSETPTPTSLVCYICNETFRKPHLLPCLHVFCLTCLQDECQGNSPDKFYCPLCVTSSSSLLSSSSSSSSDQRDKKSVHARPWHSFQRIEEKESENEELQKRLAAELPAFDYNNQESWDQTVESDDSSGGSGSNSCGGRRNKNSLQEAPSLFPCTMHADRLADTFCFKCQQLACHKCISSFHRRCQQFSELKEAVETKRSELDQMHSKMASNLVSCNQVESYQSDRIKELEEMRTRVLIEIKTFRTELVNMILTKEKNLTTQANRLIDQMKLEATTKINLASRMSESLQKQMEFLDISISVKGEGELLPLFSGIMSGIENDAKLIGAQCNAEIKEVTFSRDEKCKETITNSLLGQVNMDNAETENSTNRNPNDLCRDLNLTLMTSFHGGTRDDVTEPLLTDLILLANGDVILTDRDNKCVKKFNQSGKLLTRVIIDAVPSRIASVSHGRAVVSVMTKKCLYFLSLFGTVRILNSVPVKKIYSFLTSIGNGLLIAGTNQCDSIDLISERGETIRKIFTQKPDRATIARPLYLTPVVPHSTISLKLQHSVTNNKTHASVTNNCSSSSGSSSNGSNSNSNIKTSASNNNSISAKNHKNETTSNNKKSSSVLDNKTSSSSSSSSILPQIVKNGKSSGSHHQSPSTTTTTMSSSSKGSKRKGSLPTTQHVSSTPGHLSSPPSTSSSSLSSSTNQNINPPPSSSQLSPSSSSSLAPSLQQPKSSPEIDLLVSDSGKRVLFRMQQDGTTAFTLKSNDQVTLECPLGVTVHENGLTLLSDRDTDSILLLDNTGKVLKKVLSSSDGVTKPCGIYAGNKGVVALSQVDGMVKIYKPS